MKLNFFSVLTLLFITLHLNSQSFEFELWETNVDLASLGRVNISISDSSGAIWIGGSARKIASYNNEEWEVIDLGEAAGISVSSFTRITDIHIVKNGDMWVTTDKGIFQRSDSTWNFYSDELEKSFAYTIAESDSSLLFSTRGGIMTFDGENWGYEAIQGNQPGYVAIDADEVQWVSFSNGDGVFYKENGLWVEAFTGTDGPCTSYGLGLKTSPARYMWLYGASGKMCFFDGSEWINVENEGGKIGILNTIAFSLDGNHTLMGGEDFISGRQIKHFFNEELLATYSTEDGLKEFGEVTALAMPNSDEIFVFYEDAIYRGAIPSSIEKTVSHSSFLLSNLVSSNLVITESTAAKVQIFSFDGAIIKTVSSFDNAILIDVSHLEQGQYLCIIHTNEGRFTERFIKI